MKLTIEEIKQIIKEEIKKLLEEAVDWESRPGIRSGEADRPAERYGPGYYDKNPYKGPSKEEMLAKDKHKLFQAVLGGHGGYIRKGAYGEESKRHEVVFPSDGSTEPHYFQPGEGFVYMHTYYDHNEKGDQVRFIAVARNTPETPWTEVTGTPHGGFKSKNAALRALHGHIGSLQGVEDYQPEEFGADAKRYPRLPQRTTMPAQESKKRKKK